MTPRKPNITEMADGELGEIVRENVIVERRTFKIDRPSASDLLLDHPAIQIAFVADEYLPYWADLWPASRMLARAILRADWPAGTEALELGCGLGLAGIAALAKGVRVVFSDYDRTALRFAAANARLNGFRDLETLLLDWRQPPEGRQFPLILGSDLCYEQRNIEPLVALVEKLLAPDGLCLLTDPDRPHAPHLRNTLTTRGLHFTTEFMRAGQPGGDRVKGTLYRIGKFG